ncbi:CDP-alcohol phosphatidyltransferase family protein [Acinetobacter boissieri]|uniref:CDP-diacylglycerol--glycerol-3-phosphate 3-phosphatidyltransferase n=1 Tax=Acinetobacter boissieri TaxID=1219383 RepID=A0A1G6H6S7_9GAMM|nr:CDP-alcohol phosphatidyltransferase family protein [Acinetobacter boissieri]SDB89818.1 CDP-diacylglycerol--glycerol-3-phosphate 3-phosphatidyltransferase [Acinetobacter boissieri]
MPSIYSYKSQFQDLLRPVVKVLYHFGVTANQITLFAAFLSILLALFVGLSSVKYVYASFLLIPLWMFLRMAFNAIDGMLAKEFAQQSALGAYLNELCDVVSDTALYACFLFLPTFNLYLLFVVIFLALVSEYAGVIASLVGIDRRYDGPMGKSDRAFLFGLLGLIVGLWPWFKDNTFYVNWVWQYAPNVILSICLVLLLVTIYNRVHNGVVLHTPKKNELK